MKSIIKTAAVLPAAALLAFLATPAAAQEATGAPILLAQTTVPPAQTSAQVDTDKLIGRDVKNAQDETVGEIKSVMLGADGKTESVIVGVGGFLGMGEHEVAIGWNNIKVANGGEKVTTDLTKDQLKALPEYKYADTGQRGMVFSRTADRVQQKAGEISDRASQAMGGSAPSATAPTASTSASVGMAAGNFSTSEVVGLTLRDDQDQSIGSIKDVLLKSDGSAQTAIISVGGILGIGDKRVQLAWDKVRFSRENGQLKANVTMSKDQLAALPEHMPPARAEAPPRSESPARTGITGPARQ